MDSTLLIRAIEAILYVSGDPVSLARLEAIFAPDEVEKPDLKEALAALRRHYMGRGVELQEVGGGYQLRTSPELGPILARLDMPRPVKLSQAALETLAIIAYRQPVTRADAEEVRGVDCGAVFRTMVERGLVRVVGKKDVPGRPMLYGTTRKFLEVFGLSSLTDLPTLRQIEELVVPSEEEEAEIAQAQPEPDESELEPLPLLEGKEEGEGEEAQAAEGEGEEPSPDSEEIKEPDELEDYEEEEADTDG